MRVDTADEFAYILRVGDQEIPDPEREFVFASPRKFRFDFAWPQQRVALEVDGGRWQPNGGRHASDTDKEKQNIACARGWRVMHVSPAMIRDDPCAILAQLAQALEWQPAR
jgi:very-short-patch-repair endonuclease